MPIIRSSKQKKITLEDFYKELAATNATTDEKEIGNTMLDFIVMVNETFMNTVLYALVSYNSLEILSTDNSDEGWYVKVYCLGDKKLDFEYKMPEELGPWNGAVIKGHANTIEEAKDFLVIAMTESGGWWDNKELRKNYNRLKGRETQNTRFTLWLEFEQVDPANWDSENGFCNIHVDLEDGRQYGLNVWSYKFLETSINEDKITGQNLKGLYQRPQDLFVKELTRECIHQTIEDLLKIDDLEKVLNTGIM